MRALHDIRAYFLAAVAALLSTFALTAAAQVPTVPWPPSPPVKLAVNPVTNKVYVVNEGANTVTVLDAATNVARTINVGPRPFYIAANPATNRIYVNNAGDSTVSVIDGATDAVVARLDIGSVGPIQIDPLSNTIYVVRLTGPGTDEVTFINGDNLGFYTIATESFQPIAVALNPATAKMYIAHYATGDIRVISSAFTGNAHPATVSIGAWSRPVAIAANPVTNRIYFITEDARGPIGIINGATNTATFPAIPAGHLTGPRAIAVNTVSNKIYAAFLNELAVIDGASGAVTLLPLGTGAGPVAIGINTFTNTVYIAKDSGSMTILDGATNAMSEVGIPAGASSLGVNSITNEIYVFGSATTILDGSGVAVANPIITTIAPLPGNAAGANVTFSLTASSAFAPNKLPVDRVYVQMDSREGAWTRATGTGPFTATFSGLANGSHTLYAFGADGQDAPLHTASQSAPLVGTIASYAFTVGSTAPPLATPTVSLASSTNPSSAGQSVTLTATVTGTAGAPSGTVDFRNGATSIAGCSAAAVSAGRATCTTTALPTGTLSITAAYSGDASYTAATSGALTQTVNAAKTIPTVGLASSANPSLLGASVTFTATVSGNSGAPTGTVSFQNGANAIAGCTAVAVGAGKATCTTSSLPLGANTIIAQYSGDAAYTVASNSILQGVVTPTAPATVTLASSGNPSSLGASVTFTATVSGGNGTPTGIVSFTNGGSAIAGCTALALTGGKASCTTSSLPAGANTIGAQYSGSSAYNAASASLTQTVNAPKAATTTTLASSLNPSIFGDSVIFTATVASASGAPAGAVEFRAGSAVIAGCSAVALSGGKASCSTSALGVGSHAITASYAGSSAHVASSSTLTQAVQPAPVITAAELSYPAGGMVLMGGTQAFEWAGVTGATYTLWIGSAVGTKDIGVVDAGSETSTVVKGLPTDGRRIYVRLITRIGSSTQSRDFQYVADSKEAAEIRNPPAHKRLKGTSQSFKWSEPKGATRFTLRAGTTLGGAQIAAVNANDKSVTVGNLPTDGSWVYVRLGWTAGGVTYFRDYAYRAYEPKNKDDDADHDRWGGGKGARK